MQNYLSRLGYQRRLHSKPHDLPEAEYSDSGRLADSGSPCPSTSSVEEAIVPTPVSFSHPNSCPSSQSLVQRRGVRFHGPVPSTSTELRTDGASLVARMSNFRASLEKADPALSKFYERLAIAGIHNEQSLIVFGQFPRRDKERFLRKHCGLSVPLELYQVRLALERAQERLAA